MQTQLLPLASILDDGRQRQDYGDLAGLISSIEANGLLQPIVVTEEGESFRLIAGGRRFRAHQMLKREVIPAVLLSQLSLAQRELLELEENIRRKDLAWPELVRGIARFQAANNAEPEVIARMVQMSPASIRSILTLAPQLDAMPELLRASSWSSAHDLYQSKAAKAADAAIEDILSGGFDVSAEGEVTMKAPASTSLPGTSIVGESKPSENVASAPTAPPPTFTNTSSFLHWAPAYEGRRFNLIHCDFPYGLNMDTANLQGSSDRWEEGFAGRYDDSPELFDNLCRTFFDNQDRFISDSAHCIFWLAHKHVGKLWSRFAYHGWTPCEVNLIWHKSDNAGIAPDVRRQPRRTYEIAIFATRGDRKIAKVKSASFAAPTTKEHHLSEKPLAVVTHFLEMIVDEHTEILDPTCGSGTALDAALRLGASRAFGLDVKLEHTEYTERRCQAAVRARERAPDGSVADLI